MWKPSWPSFIQVILFSGELPWKTVVFQKASLHGFSRVSCTGEEGCLPLGNPAAMSPKWDLGQWLCAPLFRAVCPFLIV